MYCCGAKDEISHQNNMTDKISVPYAIIRDCTRTLIHNDPVVEICRNINVLRTLYDYKHLRICCGCLKYEKDVHMTFIAQFK
jgi:hypothetical protein